MKTRNIGRVAAGATALLLGVSLVACSADSGDNGGGDASADSIEAALEKGGEITYWTWTPSAEAQVAAFEEAYPNVTVKLVDTAAAADHNLKLQNAITAGSGAPDVAQLEYQSLPQFVLPGALVDLTEYGFAEHESLYTASTWGAVTTDDGIWGLPQDSGPMALFYNTEVFEGLGIEVPTTWDEYIAAGEAIHAADPTKYITNDPGGDAGFGTSMIWQAGGRPFQTEGETVTVNLQDEGSKKWADTWNTLLQNDLLGAIPGWSDEWFQALSDGTIASLPIGAWMPGVLESSAPDGAGKWRVAPMPTYDGGEPTTAENGGSSQVVLEQSKNKALAAGFLQWLNAGQDSIDVFLASGGFPATVADLESDEFLNYESEYFGGQKINEVLVDAANSVSTGWEYLPWQAYANSIYSDTVGQSYLNKGDINEGLAEWQAQNIKYGSEQGFTVSE
ncbi:sugar ABC transporter substrate-binding protein [Agromyces atrinae]|uniref:ABC transporter substrate-binding protein n=1 Tax=Agromyces atrinae TaxID=592376 RepID=UPI001F59132F|nr:sugar ABC transporter substrate-binding protein [Agromyces atrinae]MCI2957585.1 sugar ABC transporter substrate-binding protein [Agromyces atrinae]